MSKKVEFESTVLGGLPVLVRATIYPPEPDTGGFTKQVEIDEICWLSGKPVTDKVNARISKDDIYDLQYAALEY